MIKMLHQNIRPLAILGLLIFILPGCSATGPLFQPASLKDDSALVYLYRESKLAGCGNVFTIIVNDNAVANFASGSYFPMYSPAGELEFIAVNHLRPPFLLSAIARAELKKKVQLQLTVKAGSIYYVRIVHGFGGIKLEQVSDTIGQQEIAQLNLAEKSQDNGEQ